MTYLLTIISSIAASISFREASIAERPKVASLVIQNHLRLSEDCPVEYLAQVTDIPTDFENLLHDEIFEKGTYFVAVHEKEDVVACAGITPKTSSDGESASEWILCAVTVHPDFRCRGLGSHLINMAISEARKKTVFGAETLELVTLKEKMASACRLYERLDFKVVKTEKVRDHPMPMTVLWYNLDLRVSDN